MRLLFPFLFTLPFACFSQSPDSLQAVADLEKALAFLEKDQSDSLLFYQKKAGNYFIQKRDLVGWIGLSRKISKAFHTQKKDAGKALEILMVANDQLPLQPQDEKEWDKLAWLQVQIGYLSFYGGQPNIGQAVKFYEAAVKIFEEKIASDEHDIGKYVYQELGNLYTRLGDYEAAQISLQKAKRIGVIQKRDTLAALACSDIALILIDLGKFDEAIAVCREGLVFEKAAHYAKGMLESNLAKAYRGKEDFVQSLKYGNEAKKTLEDVVQREEHWRAKAWLSDVHTIIGTSYSALRRYDEAEIQLKKALQIALEFYAPEVRRREIAKMYGSIGAFYLDWGKPELALENYHLALQHALPSFDTKDLNALPPAASFFPENAIKEALAGKAASYERLFAESQKPEHLQLALRCRSLSFEVDKQLRQTFQFESSKLVNSEESQKDCGQGIETALLLHSLSGAPKGVLRYASMLDSAFHFAEINKSVLLYEALRHSNAGSVANVPDSLLQRAATLREKIAGLEKDLFLEKQSAPDKATGDLENEILSEKQWHKALLEKIGKEFPAFYRQRFDERLASVAETQGLLRPSQALVEYFVGDSALYIFLIKKDAFHVERVPKNFPLEGWVTEFRQGIEAFQFPGSRRDSLCHSYTKLAQALYQKLLKPIENQGLPQDLLIVPGGILGFLPFDALLYEAPASPCVFKKYPYLLRRHNISYNYSSTLFKELMLPARRKPSAGFVGFAPEFAEGNASGFGVLHFNMPTVAEIAALYGDRPYLKNDANSLMFREKACKASLLCLATHAQANMGEGDFSFIILSNGSGGFDTVFVKDIYNLPLSADLVFLGACETGSGTWRQGEGIISLARGFLYAGARSVVTTLWSINDESNKRLTVSFFRRLHEGMRKDEALWEAKKEQLAAGQDLYAHPVFWAAYTPIGNMEAVERKGSWKWWLLGAGVGLAGLAVFFRRGWKRNF